MDTGSVATRIEAALNGCDRAGMILAVMGCEVNGPGEARDATLAIVGTARGAAVYEHGHLVSTGAIDDAMDVVIEKVLATPANEPDSDLTWGTPDSSE
jgi:(E)-4-hydroxy-3-methylbut-2-enyl-diphosphate synthase